VVWRTDTGQLPQLELGRSIANVYMVRALLWGAVTTLVFERPNMFVRWGVAELCALVLLPCAAYAFYALNHCAYEKLEAVC
jgi:hypothetical protein